MNAEEFQRILKEVKSDDPEIRKRYETAAEVATMLLPFCKDGKILDFQGHYKQGESWYKEGWWQPAQERLEEIIREMFLFSWLGDEQLQGLIDAVNGGVELEEPIQLGRSMREHQCPTCSQSLRLGFNGKGFVWMGKPCEFADGIVTEFELNVPSGKIVVDDDLRTWFPVDEDYDVNGMVGCHLSSLAAAKVGMAYGFVGNTCPHVYRNGDDKFVIGNYREEVWDNEKKEYFENPDGCPWGEDVASICTDLWWYSIADYDDFARRVAHYTPDKPLKKILKHWTFNVVDVKPGVYKFRQVQGIDRDAPTVEFASFEWVRDPDPVRDLLKEDMEKHVTATEYLIQSALGRTISYRDREGMGAEQVFQKAIANWKKASDEDRAHWLASAAHSAMFQTRADDWHENGFPRATIEPEIKELAAEYGDVPPFDFRSHWGSPSDDFDALCLGAGMGKSPFGPFPELDPSFVLLGLNICQSAIKYGEEVRMNKEIYPPAWEVPFAREHMAKFVETYRAYRKKFPDIVFDAEFDRWMNETDLDKYVAEFDYGVTNPPKEEWGEPPPTMKKGRFFVFDSSKIKDGGFCWAQGAWASKENAERYAIGVLSGTQSAMGHLHSDGSARPPSMIPLKAVGRVLRGTGEGHSSADLVVTFDYGTENMRGEMVFRRRDMVGVEQFDDEKRYADLLEQHKIEYAKLEAAAKPKKNKKKAVKKKAKKKKSSKKK